MSKKARRTPGGYVDPPLTPIPSVDRIIEEGVLIAASAVRMTVKNAIIVAALRDHSDFDEAAVGATARADFVRLADESDETAGRLERSKTPRKPRSESKVDANRREEHLRRPLVERRLAAALRAEADNDAKIESLVTRAREDASDELQRAVVSRLVSATVEPDPDYEEFKAGRLAYLISVDLEALRHP